MSLASDDTLRSLGYSEQQINVRRLVEDTSIDYEHAVDLTRISFAADEKSRAATLKEYIASAFIDVIRSESFAKFYKASFNKGFDAITLEGLFEQAPSEHLFVIFMRSALQALQCMPEDGVHSKLSDEEIEKAHKKVADASKFHTMDLSSTGGFFGRIPKQKSFDEDDVRKMVKDEVEKSVKERLDKCDNRKLWVNCHYEEYYKEGFPKLEKYVNVFSAEHDVVDVKFTVRDKYILSIIIYRAELPEADAYVTDLIKKLVKGGKDGN